MQVRTRFAPSPTGFMHIGGLRTALYAYLFARKHGGKFILRIEDTDQEREVPGAVERIYSCLKDAGLYYDEGPDVGGDYGPYIQSERKASYLPYAEQLIKSGHAYYCFCAKQRLDDARAEVEKSGGTFKYDKHCLKLTQAEIRAKLDAGCEYVIRQNIPTQGTAGFDDLLYGHIEAECSTLDDNVLIKADGLPTYNFANVIDDHTMGITHVIRGTEYLPSAPKYNLLYEAFGWMPPKYIHLPVVMRDQHHKLSKRAGDPTYDDLLEEGYLREAIINFIALLGWSPRSEREFFTLEELCEVFDTEGLSKSPAIFDKEKLTWFNAEYMRRLPFDEYLRISTPWFEKALAGKNIDVKRLAELMQGRTEALSRIPDMVDFLAEMPEFDAAIYSHKKMKTNPDIALAALRAVKPVLEQVENWTEAELHDRVMEFIPETGMKNGQMLWPLRIAISGRESTPGGAFEIAYLLGRDETLARLNASIERLVK